MVIYMVGCNMVGYNTKGCNMIGFKPVVRLLDNSSIVVMPKCFEVSQINSCYLLAPELCIQGREFFAGMN